VIDSRRVIISVTIGGHDATSYLSPSLLSFSYTDNASGKADSLQIELQDREGKWAGAWAPKKGTEIKASFRCMDWFGEGQHGGLNCGSFKVDEKDLSGPPDKISLKAVSASLSGGLRETFRDKSWEGHTLKGVADEIAGVHGLSLVYEAPELTFARQDQREESDLAFISRLAGQRGINVKVHDDKLVLYGAKEADARPAGLVISKTGGQFSPKSYRLKEKSEGTAFTGCVVSYRDPDTQQVHSWSFDAKGNRVESAASDAQKVWAVNKRVESEAEARKMAQDALRAKNQGEHTGSLEIMGHPGLVAGMTLSLVGFPEDYDGSYFVEKAEHKIGSGYTTSVEIRRTLGY